MSLFSVSSLVITILSITVLSDGINGPEGCCQLKLETIELGDDLPKDYILAGVMDGVNQAYAVLNNGFGIKSDNRSIGANWMWHYFYPNRTDYNILTNPNKCDIKWYITSKDEEPKPDMSCCYFPESKLIRSNPPLTKLFGRWKNSTTGEITPGEYFSDGNLFVYPVNPDGSSYHRPWAGTEILYVHC